MEGGRLHQTDVKMHISDKIWNPDNKMKCTNTCADVRLAVFHCSLTLLQLKKNKTKQMYFFALWTTGDGTKLSAFVQALHL